MSIGIIGYGSFGAFVELLIRRFAPEVRVVVHSSRTEPDGGRFVSLEDAAACDAVILAVPIAAFEETLRRVMPHLGEHTVIVDVATVKVHTTKLLRELAVGKRYLATHPMFGPESYQKRGGDVAGMRIVVTEHTLEDAEEARLIGFLQSLGFDVVQMTSEEHDKHLAETLFLTHFVGQTVSRGGFDRTQIDTVSFGYLMDAVESVRHDTSLFRDVYRFNPFCEETLKRFETAEGEVHALLKNQA